MKFLSILLLGSFLSFPVLAQEAPSKQELLEAEQASHDMSKHDCVDQIGLKTEVITQHDRWIVLNHDEYMFARGIYMANKDTPSGLPPGNGAVLIRDDQTHKDGYLVFIDDDYACDKIKIPALEIDLFDELNESYHFRKGT